VRRSHRPKSAVITQLDDLLDTVMANWRDLG
jgi:hypothetical protein